MAPTPRLMSLCAAVAALLLFAGAAGAQDVPPSALTIVSRGPDPEFRIRGVSLKSVRADDTQNAVAFDFNGPVSDEAFTRLQDELPDWIDMAYAGYDNAVIRARRPVTFMTRAETDGFSLRLVPRGDVAPAPAADLRGPRDTCSGGCPPRSAPPSPQTWHAAESFYARAAAERPFDVSIRGFYDAVREGGTSYIALDGDWRHTNGQTVIASNAHADLAVWEDLRLLGDLHYVVVNAKAVRQSGGGIAPYNRNDLSGAFGFGIPLGGAEVTAQALYGRSGVGGRLSAGTGDADWRLGLRGAYHEPYTDTAQAVAFRAERDYTAVYAAGQLVDGLWASGEFDATRYGVHADSDVARTLGWHGGLRYDFSGWPFSLTYDGDGEYVLHSHKYTGAAPTPYVPLSIRDREVHQFGGNFSDKWDDGFWFDLYGGWAIDRYSDNGPYGGLALRFTPGPGFDVALNGRYSTVAERQGELGHELSGGLRLTYAWDGGTLL